MHVDFTLRLGKCKVLVQSISYFDPSQIATEGFSLPFISLKYTDQHMKSLEKSRKGKIHFFDKQNIALDGHENEAVYINLLSYVPLICTRPTIHHCSKFRVIWSRGVYH